MGKKKNPKVHGYKSQWMKQQNQYLLSHLPDLQAARNCGQVGSFYNRITVFCLLVWGPDMKTDTDKEKIFDEPEDDKLLEIPGISSGTEKDQQKRREEKVSGHGNDKKVKQLFAAILKEATKPPRKSSVLAQYQKIYYQDKIKATVTIFRS
ncbi:hypothetical protein CERSUDRAFT_99703 [Gelatoporia subvermispora B]|uniref:Uncharacterized protein n=1 Tax=Ceriporiopsis subvermispora (strain B) TaxID=914234 RepID=M2Q653_CERS8|nr:hypothetical protein CERSUDRAFT_99703 [Gelatoporia subvermispora B]